MIVADTSALVSLATGEALDAFLEEFDVHATRRVLEGLRSTAAHDDSHGEAARRALDPREEVAVHEVEEEEPFTSSRVDEGEGSCAALAEDLGADFLATDDVRAFPELRRLVTAEVVISPVALKALVKRGALSPEEAQKALDRMADDRDWLESPIYQRARELFED